MSEHERIGIRESPRRGTGFGGAAEERCPIFARASRSSERWGVRHAAAPTDRGPHATSYLARPLRLQPEAFVRRHDHGLPPRLARRLKVAFLRSAWCPRFGLMPACFRSEDAPPERGEATSVGDINLVPG